MAETGKMKSQTPISYSTANTLWGLSRLLQTSPCDTLHLGAVVLRESHWAISDEIT